MIYNNFNLKTFTSSKTILAFCGFLAIWFLLEIKPEHRQLLAQITPDNSLGDEKSIVNPNQKINDLDADLIEGGARRGSNLFHSFQEFNIDAGKGAYFNNPAGIENIFGRVTGESDSQILGTLGIIGGNADLFFLNPNGIIFGENSSLDVNGSFLATTADSLIFDNDFEFSSTNPQTPPLLTISTPIGVQFGSESGGLTNRSQTKINNSESPAGLQVSRNENIALVGGKINFENGYITTNDGQIILGSFADNSPVKLNISDSGWQLNYERVQNFQDIQLKNSILLNNSSQKPGSIIIKGRHINLSESFIVDSNTGEIDNGIISINASEKINLRSSVIFTEKIGFASDIRIETAKLSILEGSQISSLSGDLIIEATESVEIVGTNVEIVGTNSDNSSPSLISSQGITDIDTQKLILHNGGRIQANTSDFSDAGNIDINASNSIEIKGKEAEFRSGIFSRSERNAKGNGGRIEIDTNRLLVENGGEISAATLSEQNGNGGNIQINDAELILIHGVSTDEKNNSRITVTTENGSGTGGKVDIDTEQLILEDGGQIIARTFASGDAGIITINASESIEVVGNFNNFFSSINSGVDREEELNITGDAGIIDITTRRFSILDGGDVSITTRGTGEGGELTVNAKTIELKGLSDPVEGESLSSILRAETLGLGRAGDLNIIAQTLTLEDGADISVRSTASGNSGELNIAASDINIFEGAKINVSATGEGEAGSLNIDAQNINLNNGSLAAETRRGNKGNINLNNLKSLFLLNGSQITTKATDEATGGNITIGIDGDLTMQGDNNLISAEAVDRANGGNVNIDADSIIAFPQNNDIQASAKEGDGGKVTINAEILGMQERDLTDITNDINASSEDGLDGDVLLSTPDTDLTSDLIELPTNPIDVEQLLATSCIARTPKDGSFVITGRGGLQVTPKDAMIPTFSTGKIQTISPAESSEPEAAKPLESEEIVVEPTGVYRLPNGQMILSHECK